MYQTKTFGELNRYELFKFDYRRESEMYMKVGQCTAITLSPNRRTVTLRNDNLLVTSDTFMLKTEDVEPEYVHMDVPFEELKIEQEFQWRGIKWVKFARNAAQPFCHFECNYFDDDDLTIYMEDRDMVLIEVEVQPKKQPIAE